MFYDGVTGYTDKELDELVVRAKQLGFKVRDRRKWWNRIFYKKAPRHFGIDWNIKTQKPEIGK